jgi:hypothetical protein
MLLQEFKRVFRYFLDVPMFKASKEMALPAKFLPLKIRNTMPKIAVGATCQCEHFIP